MNSTVLITGATSWIGLEFARVFADHTHDLILVARNEERLKNVAREIERNFHVATKMMVKDFSKPSIPLFGCLLAHTQGNKNECHWL